MSTSPLTFFSQAFPSNAIHNIAGNLGTSDKTVLEGVQSSIAAVFSGLSQRSGERGFLGQILQTASTTPENAMSSALNSGALTNPGSSFLTSGNTFLSSVFGNKLGAVTDAIGAKTGLRTAAASALLAVGGQTVLSFLGSRVRDGSVTPNSLPGLLAHESDELKGMLPSTFHTVGMHKVDVDPVVAQAVQPERRRLIWPWLLALLAAILLCIWLFRPRPQPVAPAPVAVTQPAPAAPVAAPITSTYGTDLGGLIPYTLPDGTILHFPQHGVEANLLAFIRDPDKAPDTTSWFTFDRIQFATDSATLEPQSTEQLNNVAAILKSYPAVHLKIGGYTDNSGDPAHNLSLSQARANSVVAQLTSMGIAPDRLLAKGYGDQWPQGDNATEEGRALNRRVSMLVTQK